MPDPRVRIAYTNFRRSRVIRRGRCGWSRRSGGYRRCITLRVKKPGQSGCLHLQARYLTSQMLALLALMQGSCRCLTSNVLFSLLNKISADRSEIFSLVNSGCNNDRGHAV